MGARLEDRNGTLDEATYRTFGGCRRFSWLRWEVLRRFIEVNWLGDGGNSGKRDVRSVERIVQGKRESLRMCGGRECVRVGCVVVLIDIVQFGCLVYEECTHMSACCSWRRPSYVPVQTQVGDGYVLGR